MRRREKKNVYRSQENIRHDSWDIYSRTGGIRNDYDNNTADHNGCGSGPGNYDNAIFAQYYRQCDSNDFQPSYEYLEISPQEL